MVLIVPSFLPVAVQACNEKLRVHGPASYAKLVGGQQVTKSCPGNEAIITELIG